MAETLREKRERMRKLLDTSNDWRIPADERQEAYQELGEFGAADPEVAAADAAAAADQAERDAEMTRLFEAAAAAKGEG